MRPKKICEDNAIEIPSMEGRGRKRVSCRLDQMHFTEHQFQTFEEKVRVEFYYEVLDCLIQQIEERFSQSTQELLTAFASLSPKSLLDPKYDPI